MKILAQALPVLLLLAPLSGRCANEVKTVCDVYEQAERLDGEVVLLSGIYVDGPTAKSGFTDYGCPRVRIFMWSFAREPERDKVTAQFRDAFSFLYHYNVAIRLQARVIVLWTARFGPHIEIDQVYSFQPAPGEWWSSPE